MSSISKLGLMARRFPAATSTRRGLPSCNQRVAFATMPPTKVTSTSTTAGVNPVLVDEIQHLLEREFEYGVASNLSMDTYRKENYNELEREKEAMIQRSLQQAAEQFKEQVESVRQGRKRQQHYLLEHFESSRRGSKSTSSSGRSSGSNKGSDGQKADDASMSVPPKSSVSSGPAAVDPTKIHLYKHAHDEAEFGA